MPRDADLTDLRLERAQILELKRVLAPSLEGETDDDLLLDMIEGETSALEKCEALVEAIWDAQADASECALRARKYRDAQAVHEARKERLRAALAMLVREIGVDKLRLLAVTISCGDDHQKLVVTEKDLIPRSYLRPELVPDRAAIRSALLAGHAVAGAELQSKYGLTIRGRRKRAAEAGGDE